MSLTPTLISLYARIEQNRRQSPLAAAQVTLLAAGKGQSAERLSEAIAAGVTDFGENRVQEAAAKWPGLRARNPAIRLHLIGPLQSNKAAQAVELFDVIQTLDRKKLAAALAAAMRKADKRPPCLIQVNTGAEPQKAGVLPGEAADLIDYCRQALRLPIAGLMCIPPAGEPAAPHFALLRQIALAHGLHELSMGMSDDFETAVRLGATCVRLGRALFGERG